MLSFCTIFQLLCSNSWMLTPCVHHIITVNIVTSLLIVCVSWIDKCGSSWLCGTILEKEIYETLPPMPCPLPPHPPVKPGTCKLDVSSGQCNFFPNKSKLSNVTICEFTAVTLVCDWRVMPLQGCCEYHYFPN